MAQQVLALGIGTWSLKRFFNDLHQKVNATIDKAAREGDLFTEKLMERTIHVIDNAQAAYNDSMNATIEKVDDAVQRNLVELRGLVDEVDRKTLNTIDQLTDRVNLIVDRFPLTSKIPQIRKIEGNFVDPSRTEQFFLIFRGNFPEISENKPIFELNGKCINLTEEIDSDSSEAPESEVLNESNDIANSENSQNKISEGPRESGKYPNSQLLGIAIVIVSLSSMFQLYQSPEHRTPLQILVSLAAFIGGCILTTQKNISKSQQPTPRKNQAAAPTPHVNHPDITLNNALTFTLDSAWLNPSTENSIGITKGLLKFPRQPTLLNPNPGADTFNILIGTLPPRPGTIILERTPPPSHTPQQRQIDTIIKSGEVRSSKNVKQFKRNASKEIILEAPPGWTLNLNTFNIQTVTENRGKYIIPKGSYGHEPPIKSNQKIVVKIWTKLVGHGRSGWAKYEASCQATKIATPTPTPRPIQDVLRIGWGESESHNLLLGDSFRVIFQAFNGRRKEISNQPEYNDPYIEVSRYGQQLNIRVKDPKEIVFG